MSWEDQGRQYHGWFGTGTSTDTPDPRQVATQIGYAVIGHLSAAQRPRYESWLSQSGLDTLVQTLPAWTAAASLPGPSFHDILFGPNQSQTVAAHAQAVGQALSSGIGEREALAAAGASFASLVTAARPEALPRVMATAAERAATPQATAIVKQAAARTAPRPARPPTEAERQRAAAAQRQRNIDNLARIMFNEARGVSRDAMTAVGFTVRNRMLRNGVENVDQAWSGYDYKPHPMAREEQATLDAAKQIATQILYGGMSDPTDGATHFYTPQTMPNETEPTKSGDKKGGLEDVPGVINPDTNEHTRNYRPEWSTTFKARPMPSIPEKYFKFYRQPDGPGRVR